MCCSKRRAAAIPRANNVNTVGYGSNSVHTQRDLGAPPTDVSTPSHLNQVDGKILEKIGIHPPSYNESMKVERAIVPAEPEAPVLQKLPSLGAASSSSTSSSSQSLASVNGGGLQGTTKYERKLAKLEMKMARLLEKRERKEERRLRKQERKVGRKGCCC